jgi:L-lactate dehydrogenase complex protein LldF
MGAVLTPSLIGIEEAGHLPNATTFCGRCESVCPVKIPLPKMMRHWREREYAKQLSPPAYRRGLAAWAWVARRPALYHAFTETASRALGWAGGRRGRFRTLPLAAGWTSVRDMPAPEGRSFHSLWAQRQKNGGAR